MTDQPVYEPVPAEALAAMNRISNALDQTTADDDSSLADTPGEGQ